MKICNIFSIENQKHYKGEEYVMILAHLLKKHLYKTSNFNDKQYIILDNGLYEGEQVGTKIEDLVHLAETSGTTINEIVVPDVMNDYNANVSLFERNLRGIEANDNKYRFMVVAHGKDFNDFKRFIKYINNFDKYNLSVAVPKCCNFDRTSDEAIEQYVKCKFPIHFLGMKNTETFKSLQKVKDVVRSCDSALASIIIKYHTDDDFDGINYKRGKNEVINLAKDKVDDYHLDQLLIKIKEL